MFIKVIKHSWNDTSLNQGRSLASLKLKGVLKVSFKEGGRKFKEILEFKVTFIFTRLCETSPSTQTFSDTTVSALKGILDNT